MQKIAETAALRDAVCQRQGATLPKVGLQPCQRGSALVLVGLAQIGVQLLEVSQARFQAYLFVCEHHEAMLLACHGRRDGLELGFDLGLIQRAVWLDLDDHARPIGQRQRIVWRVAARFTVKGVVELERLGMDVLNQWAEFEQIERIAFQ